MSQAVQKKKINVTGSLEKKINITGSLEKKNIYHRLFRKKIEIGCLEKKIEISQAVQKKKIEISQAVQKK